MTAPLLYTPPSIYPDRHRSWLDVFERLSPTDPTIGWATLAADLRAEADLHTGPQHQKRIDRAVECEHRASRQRARRLQWIPTMQIEDALEMYARVESEVA